MKCMQMCLCMLVTVGLSLPVLGEQEREGRERRGTGLQGRLNEEGQAVLLTHRTQQREQMQAQVRAGHASRQELRAALQAEQDPYKQLDLLEAHVKSRQSQMAEQQEKNQQARLAA